MSDPENIPSQPLSKSEIVGAICKALIERRKARGLSLDKVFQNIKIRMPYLEAIEKGEWDQLPGDVYIRGFIKRYADHIGLDGEKLMAPYLEMEKKPEKKSLEYPPLLKGAELTRVHLIGIAVAAIVVIILIKLIKSEPSVGQATAVHSTVTPVATSTVTAIVQSPPEPVVMDRHQLDVFSPLPLWLRVSAKERVFEGFIPQGATWTWKGEGRISVRFGHTQQLAVHFDGKPVTIEQNTRKIELPSEN